MPDDRNLFLASFAPNDLASLVPSLKPIHLEQKKVLFERGAVVEHAYFPTRGIVSLVLPLSTGEMIETAMVGKDGVIGASAALDGAISTNRAIVQLEGRAMTCSSRILRELAMQSKTLLSSLVRHEQVLLAHVQQSAACLAVHQVEARLCRWLLRARDLAGTDTLNFTQEFLAEMLGVRRTSVTVAARLLQQAGMIRYSRGSIQILDVASLHEASCECYDETKALSDAMLKSFLCRAPA
jgi:CRP-like cAMP-binding protein